jgi:hypothetical protein
MSHPQHKRLNSSPTQNRVGARIAVALGVALIAALIAWVKVRQNGFQHDIAYVWYGARVWLAGGDPYAAVRPGVLHFRNWLMYPLPAVLSVAPLSGLSMNQAGIAFSGLSMGVAAFALTRDSWDRLPILMSLPALWAIVAGQWSPLVIASLCAPAYAWTAVMKPTLGFAIFLARPSWRFAIVVGLTIVVSLVAMPDWPLRWLEATRKHPDGNYAVPLVLQGGFLLLLSLLRWRRWDARLLLGMACVPQSMFMYDQLPLLLLARTRIEAISFALWSHVVPLAVPLLVPSRDGSVDQYVAVVIVWTLYLPALVIVLRRPNEGSMPAWVESLTLRLPKWLRGRPEDRVAVA